MIQANIDTKDWGLNLFKYRDYTPIPLIFLSFIVAKPNVISATLGTLLVIFGEFIRLYSVAFIGSISRTRKDSLGGKLVNTGPFKIVRNPLYVGNFFIVTGLSIYTSSASLVFLATALFCFQYYFIVQYEESLLEKKFGSEYAQYLQDVPAWIPSKLPKLEEFEWPDSFTGAIKSERRTLTAIFAMIFILAFAI